MSPSRRRNTAALRHAACIIAFQLESCAPSGNPHHVVASAWRVYNPAFKHSTHQSSDLSQVKAGFRSGLAPYQEIALEPRQPENLPPYSGSPATPECVEVYQDGFSYSARNQEETCPDWAKGKFWVSESEVEHGKLVWVGTGMARIRYITEEDRQTLGGWWIHRDLDRHGLPCRGDGSHIDSPDPLGCTGFGDVNWAPCKVRRCATTDNARLRSGDGGEGLEGKIRAMRTTELRRWGQELGLGLDAHARRAEIAVAVREHLYLNDGHLKKDAYEEFMQLADQWAAARTAETLALEALEALEDAEGDER